MVVESAIRLATAPKPGQAHLCPAKTSEAPPPGAESHLNAAQTNPCHFE